MDWSRLKAFQATYDAGSFTKASESLHVTQSAVSRQVSSLERELGVQLFQRHARGLEPTEQGRILAVTVEEMRRRYDNTKRMIRNSLEEVEGELNISANLGIGTTWLVPVLAEFSFTYPELRVRVNLTDNEEDFEHETVDTALRMRHPQRLGLMRRRLFTMHFHACASPTYIERRGEPNSPEELSKHSILSFGASAPKYLDMLNWLERAGSSVRRQPTMIINNVNGLRRLVSSGLGIAVLPDYIAANDENLVRVMKDIELPGLECYFVYPEELRSSARVKVLGDYLAAKARAWHY